MPLVPETKMADARKKISLGNLLTRRTTWSVLKTTSATLISSRVFGAYSMTRIFYKYAHLPIHTHTHTHTHTLSLSLSLSLILSLSNTHTHTHTHTFPLTEPTHTLQCDFQWTLSLSFQLATVYRHKNVYATQPFSYLLHLFGEIFFSFKNKRNFVKLPKETNNMGEDTFLLKYTIKIL